MKTIKCQNVVEGKKCGRFLGILTDLQIEILRIDEEKGFITRCPCCPPDQRWARISMRKEDGVIVWETLNPEDVAEFPPELIFDEKIICEQVG